MARTGELWIDPLMPPEVRRAREREVRPRGYSTGAEGPPMGTIVAIGGVAIAAAILLGKLGAS